MEESHNRVEFLLKSIHKASKDLQKTSIFASNFSIQPFLDLEKEVNWFLSKSPNFSKLFNLICNLKTLIENLEKGKTFAFPSILRRQIANYKIYQIAYAIDAEIQSILDWEKIEELVCVLMESNQDDDEEKIRVLIDFEKRLEHGFDLGFQDLVLKGKIFQILELLLCDARCSTKCRNEIALAISALVRFNKDVFVGLVLMGPTIRALISMGTPCSIQVLSLQIKVIRIPLVDELETYHEIPRIIELLWSEEGAQIQVAAFDCVLGIAYYARKEGIEKMLRTGLVERLVELQRWENGDDFPGKIEDDEGRIAKSAFAGCVARFAVQIEVGEMLSEKEKGEFKLEILKRVKEVCVSEAEGATIAAEVLWGSSPWN